MLVSYVPKLSFRYGSFISIYIYLLSISGSKICCMVCVCCESSSSSSRYHDDRPVKVTPSVCVLRCPFSFFLFIFFGLMFVLVYDVVFAFRCSGIFIDNSRNFYDELSTHIWVGFTGLLLFFLRFVVVNFIVIVISFHRRVASFPSFVLLSSSSSSF